MRRGMRLPAMVFQMVKGQPSRQPLQLNDFFCSSTGRPQMGQAPSESVEFFEELVSPSPGCRALTGFRGLRLVAGFLKAGASSPDAGLARRPDLLLVGEAARLPRDVPLPRLPDAPPPAYRDGPATGFAI